MTVFVDPGGRMDVEEYERLVALGELDKVELIDGVIYEVSPEFDLHTSTAARVDQLLRTRHPGRKVLQGGSVRIDGRSLWNPDVYVLDVDPDFIFPRYPDARHVLLAVEVTLTTWSRDTGVKVAAYARSGVPEYWVVDPRPDGRLIRHREPRREAGRTGYAAVDTVPLPNGVRSLTRVVEAFDR